MRDFLTDCVRVIVIIASVVILVSAIDYPSVVDCSYSLFFIVIFFWCDTDVWVAARDRVCDLLGKI